MTTPYKIKLQGASDAKLMALLDLYNDLLSVNYHIKGGTEEYKYHKKLKEGLPLSSAPFYEDLLRLYSLIVDLKVRPRDYILYQLRLYKPPTKYSYKVPTLRMLTNPAALERWNKQFIKIQSPLTESELDAANLEYMQTLMRANGLSSEEEFFKDPILLSQVSKSFLLKNNTFKTLLASGYYLRTFGLQAKDLI